MTFAGLWHNALAGGVANIWGNLALPDGVKNVDYSLPYQNKEATKTYNTFFFEKDRFTSSLNPSTIRRAIAGRSARQTIIVAYQDSTQEIFLGDMAAEGVIAVNTLAAYEEISLAVEEGGKVMLPEVSNWALVISRD